MTSAFGMVDRRDLAWIAALVVFFRMGAFEHMGAIHARLKL